MNSSYFTITKRCREVNMVFNGVLLIYPSLCLIAPLTNCIFSVKCLFFLMITFFDGVRLKILVDLAFYYKPRYLLVIIHYCMYCNSGKEEVRRKCTTLLLPASFWWASVRARHVHVCNICYLYSPHTSRLPYDSLTMMGYPTQLLISQWSIMYHEISVELVTQYPADGSRIFSKEQNAFL